MSKHSTKDGKPFIIRRPSPEDAENIINYSKIMFASTDQTLTTLEEYNITVENEKTWISNFDQNPNSLLLVAELDKQIVGLLFFMANAKKKIAHTGEFGVSIHPGFQANGIGRLLIESLLSWAKGNGQVEKVYLKVFATNHHAIRLYKELGFVEEGRHIKEIKQSNGAYVDVIQMYIETK